MRATGWRATAIRFQQFGEALEIALTRGQLAKIPMTACQTPAKKESMSGRQAAAPGLPGRRRGSLSWELRTSISLARLLTGRGGSPSTALLQPTIRSGAPRSRQTASRYANNDAKNDARPVRDNYGQPRTIADNRGRTWTRRCCFRQRGPLFPKSRLPVLSLLFVFEKLLKSLITHGNCQFLRNGLPVFLENVPVSAI